MNDKSLKLNGIRLAQIATGMSPADFPVGSLQSRAIARVILEQAENAAPRRSQYDEDAHTIYTSSGIFMHGDMSPNVDDLKKTKVYSDGKKLDELRGGEEEFFEQAGDPTDRLEEIINNCFERAERNRLDGLSQCAPVLRRAIVFSAAHKLMVCGLAQGWERQFPETPFPIRMTDDARPLVRRRNGEWEEAGEHELSHLSGWRLVEEAAIRNEEGDKR